MFSFYLGVDLPLGFDSHEIVASNDKKALFAIGNAVISTDWNSRDIYKFSCTNSITHCSWTKISTKLQYGRWNTVAMRIPNALANKLCCPEGWTRVDGKCYKVVAQKATWDTAKHKCSEMGAILAEPKSLIEDKAVAHLMGGMASSRYWIGLKKSHSQ